MLYETKNKVKTCKMSTKSLVEESVTPFGYWGSDISQIHIVKDFINQEQSQIFNNYIRTNETWNQNQNHENWIDRVHSIDIFNNLMVKDLAQKITNSIQIEIEKTLSVKLNPSCPSIIRWKVGNGQTPHADKQNNDGTPNLYPQNDIASLIYINDDYEGGEIYFPNQEFKLKPLKNSLVFFPGDINFLHGVTTITEGIRYTIPNFWKVKQIIK